MHDIFGNVIAETAGGGATGATGTVREYIWLYETEIAPGILVACLRHDGQPHDRRSTAGGGQRREHCLTRDVVGEHGPSEPPVRAELGKPKSR